MADALAPPPAWFRAARSVIRRLPAGRFRAFNLLARAGLPPFADRLAAADGGLLYRCDLRHLIAREICVTGRYAPTERALLRASLAPGGTFVDVGANIGYFALLGATAVGAGGRVVALEPHPHIAAELRANVSINRLPQVSVLELAASSEAGTATLAGFREDGNWGAAKLSEDSGDADVPAFPVRCAPLDAILDDADVGPVDLVKIDVEGAEPRVLEGMRDGLRAGRYGRVLVELHPWEYADFGAELEAMDGAMRAAGYRGWIVDPGDGDARRGYYGADVAPALRPLVPREVRGGWPHALWTRGGGEPA